MEVFEHIAYMRSQVSEQLENCHNGCSVMLSVDETADAFLPEKKVWVAAPPGFSAPLAPLQL